MSNKDNTRFSTWSFINLLFTFQCPLCEQPSHTGRLCPVCRTFLEPLRDPCPTCGEPDTLELQCGRCQKHPPPWAHARIAWPLTGATRFLIHGMKYDRDFAAARSLAHTWWQLHSAETQIDALVPVPQHRSKLRERGFNQADWLARYWSRQAGVPVWRGVDKVRATTPLEGLNRVQRRHTLKGVFRVKTDPPKRIALIDDVLTTGATAAELSRVLKRAGVEHIELWTLARTPLHR